MVYVDHDGHRGWHPFAGRCGRLVSEHAGQVTAGVVEGVRCGRSLGAGAVCSGLVCPVCGRCQAGLGRDAA